jgi:hypothetical protein
MVMAVTWPIVVSWLFRRLRSHHPLAYERIGSPSLIWNNSMRNQWLLWTFLWSSRSRELGDSAVVNVVRFMRIFFVCFVVLFLGLMFAFFNINFQ